MTDGLDFDADTVLMRKWLARETVASEALAAELRKWAEYVDPTPPKGVDHTLALVEELRGELRAMECRSPEGTYTLEHIFDRFLNVARSHVAIYAAAMAQIPPEDS